MARTGRHPLLLVGDTAAETILGHPSTVHMPLDVLIALTAAVKRGAPNTVVMGDMPFLSYATDQPTAMRNAGRFLTEGLADLVKLEADASHAPLVREMTRAGIPVCGHVGYRPQTVGLTGTHRAAGRTANEAERILDDALALEAAGGHAARRSSPGGAHAAAGQPVGRAGHRHRGRARAARPDHRTTGSSRTHRQLPAFAPRLAEWGRSLVEAARGWTDLVARRA